MTMAALHRRIHVLAARRSGRAETWIGIELLR
jgi:hypothetical protein